MTAHSLYQYFQILAVACPNYLLLLAVMLYSVGLSNHSLSPVSISLLLSSCGMHNTVIVNPADVFKHSTMKDMI